MRSNTRLCRLALALVLLGAGCASAPESELARPMEVERDSELRRAVALVDAGDDFAALSALEAWIAAYPDAPADRRAEAHARAAQACAASRQPDKGLVHAEAAIALAPEDPWLRYTRGVALHTIGEYDAALGAFSRALALDARHLKAAQWRGHTYFLLQRPAEAMRDYDTALALLEVSSDAVLAAWDANRRDLAVQLLRGRADARSALGDDDAAEADREAARTLRAQG